MEDVSVRESLYNAFQFCQDPHVLENGKFRLGATLSPRVSHAVASFLSRCEEQSQVWIACATLQRRCRHVVQRCALLCLTAATQHSVPQRIVTYHSVAKTQHNVVHAFCSRFVTCLLRCSHVVLLCTTLLPRCSMLYHVAATLWGNASECQD